MAIVKSLLDGLNHKQQIRRSDCEPFLTELTVTGVHHDLAINEKGRNTERKTPSEWLGGRSTIKVVQDK